MYMLQSQPIVASNPKAEIIAFLHVGYLHGKEEDGTNILRCYSFWHEKNSDLKWIINIRMNTNNLNLFTLLSSTQQNNFYK